MTNKPPQKSRERVKKLLLNLQENICNGLEKLDGQEKFNRESWIRPEGGGGISKVLKNCLLYTSPSPRDRSISRMPSSA